MNIALWIVQALLALLFLFAGGMKLVMPIEEMLKQMPLTLPGWFMRFIGVVEVLGAIGLILPWLPNIRPGLTPLAAAGLVIVMIGATVYTVAAGDDATGGGASLCVRCLRPLAARRASARLKVPVKPIHSRSYLRTESLCSGHMIGSIQNSNGRAR